MPEQFLHGAGVVAGLQQVSREAVPECVTARRLDDPGRADRRLDAMPQL